MNIGAYSWMKNPKNESIWKDVEFNSHKNSPKF